MNIGSKFSFFTGASALIFIFACQSSSNQRTNSSQVHDTFLAKHNVDSIKGTSDTSESPENNVDGVVVLREDYPKGMLKIYNADGSVWKSFQITDGFQNENLSPLALKPENSLLVFRCIGKKDGMYAVVVDENKSIIKYISQSETSFNYESWEKHILKVFSIDFDYKKNPIRQNPSEKSTILLYNKEEFYHPVKVQKEWLMIKDDNEKKGWIKWKDAKGDLIITLYYDA